jgi:hypothetical protein
MPPDKERLGKSRPDLSITGLSSGTVNGRLLFDECCVKGFHFGGGFAAISKLFAVF